MAFAVESDGVYKSDANYTRWMVRFGDTIDGV